MASNDSLPNPRISIITCTCNSEIFLLRALNSIECQTYKNIEHILNDSFSTRCVLWRSSRIILREIRISI